MARVITHADLTADMEVGHRYTKSEAWLELVLLYQGRKVKTTLRTLAHHWGWSYTSVKNYLLYLVEGDRMKVTFGRDCTVLEVLATKPKSPDDLTLPFTVGVTDNIMSIKKKEDAVVHFVAQSFAHLTYVEIPKVEESELDGCIVSGLDVNGTSLSEDELSFVKFNKWFRTHAPYLSNPAHIKCLTYNEYLKLRFQYKYTAREIADVILNMENNKNWRKQYANLYRALLNWLKNQYGERNSSK